MKTLTKFITKKLILSILNNCFNSLLEEKDNEFIFLKYKTRLEKSIELLKTIIKSLDDRRIEQDELEDIKTQFKRIFE